MNSLKRLNGMKYVALAALAFALSASLGNAQEAEGKFNLPFTANWGGIVLAPGEYSFKCSALSQLGGTPMITVRRGTRTLGMVQTYTAASGERFSDPSHLTATVTDRGYTITSLDLKEQGIKLRFFVPKSEVLLASQTTRPPRNVPVLQASK